MNGIDDALNNAVASNKLENNELTAKELKVIKDSLINNDNNKEFVEKTIKFVKDNKNA